MKNILDLGGRVSLVTGAGQGVGRQIALHLAAHGNAGVAVNDYFLERAEAVAEEIREAGGRAIAIQADVADFEATKRMVGRVEEELGPIGILVNNAGNLGATPSKDAMKPFWQTGPEVWQQVSGVNFFGPLNCIAAALPGMIAREKPGRIVTIISDAGRFGDANMEVYSASKAGAAGLMRSLARSVSVHGITANSVAIAATKTPATEAALSDEKLLKKVMEKYIVRRPGEPEDVANMVLFLASDASSWISGQTYPVDGGFMVAL